ncbi:MAG TPA: hypothetical protein VEV43_00445 [Actinomycetota bacterium]|nr:hypothetical protein [Actinomycetota bacterium]
MPEVLRWIGCIAGLVLVLGTWIGMLDTLVVPRGLSSRTAAVVGRVVRRLFLTLANRFDAYEKKDDVLVLQGPITLLALLVTWIVSFLLGYALILYPVENVSFLTTVEETGSAFFTLGFAGPREAAATAIHVIAAFTGLIVIALQIAYLPTLYASFNRRETLVTMLQSRAGSPAWGPEILRRHQAVNIVDNLPQLYAEWEQWAADVAESHTNYPVLVSFRSPHPLRSWIVGLLAVVDSAALYSALCPSRAPSEARLCIRMGFNCMRDIADAMQIPFDPDPLPTDPIELTFEEFRGAVHQLDEAGFPMERTPEEAWPHFRGWRVNYESVAYALADYAVAPPGPWSGPREHLPGMAIIPQRPANRQPQDTREHERPRGEGTGW